METRKRIEFLRKEIEKAEEAIKEPDISPESKRYWEKAKGNWEKELVEIIAS